MKTKILKATRKIYRALFHPEFPRWGWPTNEERIETNKLIHKMLVSDTPCFIGRMGTVEGAIILNYTTVHSPESFINKCINYITNETRMPWWDEKRPFHDLTNNAGFYSKKGITVSEVEKFAEIYIEDIPTMDLCGSFEYYERFLPFSPTCPKVQLETLYPFFVEKPWTEALIGKNILIIHPFKETIISQYNKRKLLFSSTNILPDFNLKIIKAVQTLAGEKSPFNDWFEALEYMKSEIDNIDFDIAIIGCGAYGLPLAAYVKRLGKKAIHMGGGTQLLFGIKGKRWEQDYKNSCYRDMFNEHWVYPNNSEKPNAAIKVEGGCYW